MRRLRPIIAVYLAVGLVLTLLALFIPRLVEDLSLIRIFTVANIFVMFAASWDILTGYSGQVSLGHAAFVGTAGFTVGLLSKFVEVPVLWGIVLAVAAAAIMGLIIGIPALRLRGPYLALATLAAATALLRLVFIFKDRTGGEEGIPRIPGLDTAPVTGGVGRGLGRVFVPGFADLRPFDQFFLVNYYVILAVTVLVIGGLLWLGESRFGLVLRAIRQDEDAAEAGGIPTTRYKLGAFVLSAATAGLAGALWVHIISQVGSNIFGIDLSFILIVMAVIGGSGTVWGAAVGAYLLTWAEDFFLDKIPFLAEQPDIEDMIFAVLLIITLVLMPRGLIAPIVTRLRSWRRMPLELESEMLTPSTGEDRR